MRARRSLGARAGVPARSLQRRAATLVGALIVAGGLLVGCGGGSRASATTQLAPASGHIVTLRGPISSANLTRLPFGARSDWLQPWRAYLSTVPALTLRRAIGINYNVPSPKLAPLYAQLMARAGFTRARIEVGWDQVDFADPSRLAPEYLHALKTRLKSFRRYHITPLILLNANDTGPTPMRPVTLTLTTAAARGATTLSLSPGDVHRVTAGRTGIRVPGDDRAISDLITAVAPDGTATLSAPLSTSLAAGQMQAETLLAAPFAPVTVDGRPNPVFQSTLHAWLRYVGTVTSTAKKILHGDDFDVEIWNELGFGSTFLNPAAYWAGATKADYRTVRNALLDSTVAYLRDPAHGVASIGIGDGFTDGTPFGSGANVPAGLTAIDKHPYQGPVRFPPRSGTLAGQRAVGALGAPAGDSPRFTAYLPEWFLTGLQTETLVRDLAPFPTRVDGVPHGRYVHPAKGSAPHMWITEVNLGFVHAAKLLGIRLTARQAQWLEAKAVLRYFTAYVNKGVTALYMYAADAGDLSVFDPGYAHLLKHQLKQARRSAHHSGAATAEVAVSLAQAGPAAQALSRLTASLRGARRIAHPRQLRLDAIGDFDHHVQFRGTSSPNTPPLYNRDVLAVLPFEVTPRRFVIPFYVMTRDMLGVQRPQVSATARNRFDLPPETFRLTLSDLPSCDLKLSASDPMYGSSVPLRRVGCHGGRLVVDVPAVDYPRLLTISVG